MKTNAFRLKLCKETGRDSYAVATFYWRKDYKMDLLEVGKIVNTHGLKGEVKVVPWTDTPDVFEELEYVLVKSRQGEMKLNISGIKYQKNNIIVKFRELNRIEDAEPLKNSVLSAPREMLGELPEGVYYITDLLGLPVYDEDDNLLGKVTDVFPTGSNDVYAVSREGRKDLLLPVIDDVILKVDLANKRITARVMEGLED